MAANNLLWQAPSLAIAQAFLLATIFNPETEKFVAVVIGVLSVVIAFASLQFFNRLRWLEMRDQKILETFERSEKGVRKGLIRIHGRTIETEDHMMSWIAHLSAFSVWNGVLVLVLITTLFALIYSSLTLAGAVH